MGDKKLKKAMEVVLADLKKNTLCNDKDYCIGCYGCGLRLVYKTLLSHYEWGFKAKKAPPDRQ